MNKYDHLSYSSISKFIDCPMQFYFYKNARKSLPSEPALAGSQRHAEIAVHLIDGTMDQSKFGDRMKGFCKHILKTPTAVECEFTLDFIANIVVGKIDAYSIQGNQVVIVDWKNYPGYNDELQLKIYALAAREAHREINVVHAYFFYTGPDYYETYTAYFAEDLDRFSIELSQIIDAISTTEKFEPRPGPHCTRCAYVETLCPVAKNFEIVKVDSVNEVVILAQKTYAVEALLDRAKEKIKMWLIGHGLESLPAGKEGRFYLSSSTALRTGKFKSDKEREACNKALELVEIEMVGEPSYPELTNIQPEIAASPNGPVTNIVPFAQAEAPPEKVRMTDLAGLMKKAGILAPNATSADASNAIRDRLGTNFIMATDEQKAKLKAELESMVARKSA